MKIVVRFAGRRGIITSNLNTLNTVLFIGRELCAVIIKSIACETRANGCPRAIIGRDI